MKKKIALEGIDGAGKSTQAKQLFGRLQKTGLAVVHYEYTRKENFWGRMIERLYSNNSGAVRFLGRSPYVQESMYALCARENLKTAMAAVKNPSVLISDRSIITAYASHIDVLPFWFLDIVEPRMIPDLAIFLDVPPETAVSRIQGRELKFADEDLEGLYYFRDCYMRIINSEKPKRLERTRFVTIDGSLRQDELSDFIYETVIEELKGGAYGNQQKVPSPTQEL